MTADRPPRPDPLGVNIQAIPQDLRDRDHWICWRYEFKPDRGEWSKIPVDVATGGPASVTDPDTWSTFDAARAYHDRDDRDTDGLGFVLTGGDTVLGIDLDDCRDPETGELAGWASRVLASVDSYAEASPSGTGVHVLAHANLPDGGNRADVDDAEGHLELYDDARYFTVTGQCLEDAPGEVRPANDAVTEVHAEHVVDDSETDAGREPTATTGGSGADLDDDELLEKARNAENGDDFARLWSGDTSGYPSHSEARQALANHLAFWTGGGERQMLQLFERSGLIRDDDDVRTFENYEIPTALEGRTEFYDPDSGTDDDGDRGRSVRRPEAADGGAAAETPTTDDASPGTISELSPEAAVMLAGLSTDDDETPAQALADLTDREAAAYVWELAKRNDRVHVVVRRDNGELWGWDPETGVWEPEGERALRHAARQALGSINYGKNVLEELKAQARGDPRVEVEADEFGLAPGTIAVENGLVYLDAAADGAGDDALRDLEPDDYALTRLPVEYDPSADYDEWADYVDEWAEDGYAGALQEYVGYCLHVGEIPIHRALLLVGSGANGKGTFLSVVRALLGRDNTSSIELQTLANEKDAVADFYGSLANIDDDLSARKLGQGLGMFKKLVAGDRVRARRLYEDGFEFDAVGKHLYAANEVPQVDVADDDEAFWRRWLLVEFPNHYPPSQREPDLRDRLTEPDVLSGVLNWAIDGWARLLDQGHFTGEEQYAQAKRERWQAWGDSVDKFISECVENDPDAENRTTGDVHRRYAAWCRENDERPASQQKLTTSLKSEDLGYGKSVRVDGSVQRGYKTLGFTDDVPALDDTPERADPDDSRQDSLF